MSMCPWTSWSGVVFPLPATGFVGEWVTLPHCPGLPALAIDLSGTHTYEPDYPLLGMIRCVRRRASRNHGG
jgi:hypothetical protein